MVKNGPRNMNFGNNIVCTIGNKKEYNNRPYLENLARGPKGIFLARGPFLRCNVFLNKMVKNGPRIMKFGTNAVCTIRKKKKENNWPYLENLARGPKGIF